MNICIIGTGYVGLVTGTCLAELGNRVICVDMVEEKIRKLNRLEMPIFEPGLEEIIRRNFNAKRLFFSTDLAKAVNESEIIFIAVGTPSMPNGEADLSFVENVARQIAENAKSPKIVVEKSTVPVETGKRLYELLITHNDHKTHFSVVSNPEFLREGSAVHDFLHPDRVVIGTDSENAREKMRELYGPLNCPILFTDINSAELIKHASNSFLALKISYANSLANLCEHTGADIEDVVNGMALDHRIGKHFFNAGIGYGGSCFPKDVDAFITIAQKKGFDFEILKEVQKINGNQRIHFVQKIKKKMGALKGKTVCVLGLAFKPNTDDLRCAPSLDIIAALQKEGAIIRAFDPVAMENAKSQSKNVTFCSGEFDAMADADCIVIATEWDQFKRMDWLKAKKLLKQPLIFDGRNMFKPIEMKKLGFEYISMGRESV
ncbi:MAG: UDP-glucose/GDP-mannose dehydrogenase family protein [Candidatus Micrarchaeota archaeon]